MGGNAEHLGAEPAVAMINRGRSEESRGSPFIQTDYGDLVPSVCSSPRYCKDGNQRERMVRELHSLVGGQR